MTVLFTTNLQDNCVFKAALATGGSTLCSGAEFNNIIHLEQSVLAAEIVDSFVARVAQRRACNGAERTI